MLGIQIIVKQFEVLLFIQIMDVMIFKFGVDLVNVDNGFLVLVDIVDLFFFDFSLILLLLFDIFIYEGSLFRQFFSVLDGKLCVFDEDGRLVG